MTIPPSDHDPPPDPDPGGEPAPPHHRRRPATAAVVTAVVAAAVLVIAVIAAIWLAADDDESDTAGDEGTAEPAPTPTEPDATVEPTTAEDAAGACLPFEPELAEGEIDLTTPCDDEAAFWTVAAAADEVGAAVDEEGNLTDTGAALEVCGEDWGSFRPGTAWTDWYFTYDTLGLDVEELYCVEAIGEADEDGRVPVTPETDDCFDDSERWWTVPCDAEAALYRVTDTVAIDPPEELSGDAADEAAEPCESGDLYWQLIDVEGRTTDILCGEER